MANEMVRWNYKTCTYKKFKERFTKLKEKYEDIYIHRHRILLHYGLNPRSYKKQLQEDDVKDWKRKLDYIEYKIEQYYCIVLDKVMEIAIDTSNSKPIMELIDKDKKLLYEPEEDNTNQQAIQIITNSNFELPKKIHIDPVEVKNGTD